MMRYPPDFQFSQSSLQDFITCPRRFQLRYLLRQDWPAPLVEPLREAELETKRGEQFHRLVERHYLGLPTREPRDEAVQRWFSAFLASEASNVPGMICKPEAVYSIPVREHRLTARFDLVAIEPGKSIVIMDWKTSRHRPTPEVMQKRMQTYVYFVVAQQALTREYGGPVPPEALELVYWFAEAPEEPIRFHFPNEADFQGLVNTVDGVIAAVDKLMAASEKAWPLVKSLAPCRLCNYRSLCAREVPTATLDEDLLIDLPALDLSTLEEVEL